MTAVSFSMNRGFEATCTDGTVSATTPTTFTTTNITGSPTFGMAIAATAEIRQHWQVPFATPLKCTAASTAATVVSPATLFQLLQRKRQPPHPM
jgi:hypothetical protein